MAAQKGDHLLYLVTVLGRAGKDVVVSTPFVIHDLYRPASGSELHLKVACHLNVGDRDSSISGTVRRSVQHENRGLNVSGQASRIAGRVENSGPHVAGSDDVAHDRCCATRMPEQPDSIGMCTWQRTSRLYECGHRLQGFGAGWRRHRRSIRTGDRGDEAGATPRAAAKPACRHRDDVTTVCQILGQAYVFLGEAVSAMQENDSWEGSSTAWARDCREHDAETRDLNFDPLHRKVFGAGWCFRLANGDPHRRAGSPPGSLCRSILDGIDKCDQHGGRSERRGKLRPHHFAL